ncbi:MAG TPA: DUF1697 domain-containing protein [Bryobacteraceae bacterium]|nr:DUF1697 domain-containing protein [Bryobacteraceae bacterium]
MPAIASMLRAVNLPGHNRLKMDELRDLYESLGLRGAQTYVASGNVVFQSDAKDLARLQKKIEDAIEKAYGFRTGVLLRTSAELKDIIRRNPLAKRSGIEPNKLVVIFLTGEPDAMSKQKIAQIKVGPEELVLDGRQLYTYYAGGIGTSKLTAALIERAIKVSGTARNWNTVTKLLEMTEKMAL